MPATEIYFHPVADQALHQRLFAALNRAQARGGYPNETYGALAHALNHALLAGPLTPLLLDLIDFYPADLLVNDFLHDWASDYQVAFANYCDGDPAGLVHTLASHFHDALD